MTTVDSASALNAELDAAQPASHCPFCGSANFGIGYAGQPARVIFVTCSACGAQGPIDDAGRSGSGGFDTGSAIKSALERWNTRSNAK